MAAVQRSRTPALSPEATCTASFELTLCVIVQLGTLPTFPDDEVPAPPDALNDWLYDADGALVRGSGEIAGRLVKAMDPAERHWLDGAR